MNEWITSIITGLIGAVGAWMVTHRKATADIEAARLEAESSSAAAENSQAVALEQLKAEVTEDVIRRLRSELDRVYTQKEHLERELADAMSLIKQLRDERDELRDERDELREQNTELRNERGAQGDRITLLEGVVAELEHRISHISEPLEPQHG